MRHTLRILALSSLGFVLAALPGVAEWEQGRALFQAGDFEQAARHFQAVTESHPEWAPGYFMLGQSLQQLRRPAEALASLRRAQELAPDSGQFRYALAKLYGQLGRDGEAEAMFATVDPATLAAPARGDFYESWAVIRTRSGAKEGALPLWAEAVKANPEDRELRYHHGVALFNAQRYAAAADALGESLLVEDGEGGEGAASPERWQVYVQALTNAGRFEAAVSAGQRLVALKPGPVSYQLLGAAHLGAGEYEATLAALARVEPSANVAWVVPFYAGQAHFHLGDLAAAESQFSAALTRADEAVAPRVWQEQARVYSAQKRYPEAIAAYERAGDAEGAARAQQNLDIHQHNIQAAKEQELYEEILHREREIQADLDAIRNGQRPRSP